jgi:lipid-A-disaccharide synthase-like uncharacterized protein
MVSNFWLGLGFVGQAIFGSRFVVQWISSERAGQSVIPTAFWYLSLAGALLLLTYAVYRRDPVFIIGQSVGGFIYARNLALIARKRQASGGHE